MEKMLREIDGMDENKTYKEFLVDGALMACQYGKKVIKLKKSSLSFAYVGFDEVLTDKDKPTGSFGVCHAPQIFGNPKLEKKQKIIPANESISGKEITDRGPECLMELSQTWQGTDQEMVIWDSEDQFYRSIPTNKSFLVCHYGGGCIFPIDSGQKIETKLDKVYKFMSKKGLQLLKYFEFPYDYYSIYNHLYVLEERKIVAAYPHYVGDGGITFGYGHCIKKDWLSENNNQEIFDKYITKPNVKFDDGEGSNKSPRKVGHSLPVPLTEAEEILCSDVIKIYEIIIDELEELEIDIGKYRQNEIDAIIIRSFPFGGFTPKFRDILRDSKPQADWNIILDEGMHAERSKLCGKLFYNSDYFIKGGAPFTDEYIISEKNYERYFAKTE